MKRIGKTSTAIVALTASLAFFVTGCHRSASDKIPGGTTVNNTSAVNSQISRTPRPTRDAQPVEGGTLTIAQTTKFDDSFIPDIDASLYTSNVTQFAFDPLLTVDQNLNYVPDLAKDWSWSADKKTLTITLADANWSDGQPITSDDVLFTINYLASKEYNSTLRGQYGYLVQPIKGSAEINHGTATSFADTGGFKQISEKQFSLTFDTVDAAVLWSDISAIQPLPKHILKGIPIQDWATSDFNKRPTVISGPYTFEQVNGQDSVHLVANPNYFRGKPHISNLVVQTVGADAVSGLLAKGKVQMVMEGLKPTDVSKLKQIPGINVYTPPGNGYEYLGLKDNLPEFKDVRVREAIAYGLDRKTMIDKILNGLGEPVNGPLPPVSWAAATTADGMNPYTYNPSKANQLLNQAGWKMGSNGYRMDPSTGKEANLTLSYPSNDPARKATAVSIQSDLKKIGLKVTLNPPQDFIQLSQKVQNNDKSIEMWLLGWSLGTDPDPRGLWMSNDQFNFEQWKDKTSDQMIRDTWGAKAFDQAVRKQALVKWQLYVNQQMPLVFLWAPDNIFAFSSRLNIPQKDWSNQGPLNVEDWWLSASE